VANVPNPPKVASAPGAAHLLADAAARIEPAARRNQAADAAGVGRETAAIKPTAGEGAGHQDLAVAVGIDPNWLSRRTRGQPADGAAGEEREQPQAFGSHGVGLGTI
jgi:hypothetical protein